MSSVRLCISMSLDGFVAGPDQSVENPLGVGGMRLHQWAFPLRAWRSTHGLDGGEVNESDAVVAEALANVGATVMGRNMFGGHPGPWDPERPWDGWWGRNPPFHHPVFVLTHHPRAPLELEGGTTFTFVTGGIEAALDLARRAARGKDVWLAGGANAARQYLAAGRVDAMEINLVPALLGSGERLFDRVGDDLRGLELVRTVAAPQVTHLKFTRRSAGDSQATADREFVHWRLIDAPRERVFRAFSDPAHLARWWGPKGFSNTFHEFDLRPGGAWRFVMRGPDGRDYPNASVFVEVVVPERVVFEHVLGHHFVLTITFSAQDGKTLVGWRQVFDTPAERQRIERFVTEANEQNLDRLEAEVCNVT